MNFLFFNTAALKFMQALQLFHLKYAAPFFFFFVYIIWKKINAHALICDYNKMHTCACINVYLSF